MELLYSIIENADTWYFILIIPTMIFTIWAQINVKSTFNKYSRVASSRGITGAMAAEMVLRANGVYDVKIEHISGSLTDHYDPRSNTIRLSDTVYNSKSIAAIGVAAHEAGHAVQYAMNYFPIKVRSAIIPVTQLGSKLAMPLFILGLVFGSVLVEVGILLFSLSVVFQFITLPVEFNASKRAMESIRENHIAQEEELGYARKTLTAAALTYVAALATGLLSLLRLIAIAGGRRRD